MALRKSAPPLTAALKVRQNKTPLSSLRLQKNNNKKKTWITAQKMCNLNTKLPDSKSASTKVSVGRKFLRRKKSCID